MGENTTPLHREVLVRVAVSVLVAGFLGFGGHLIGLWSTLWPYIKDAIAWLWAWLASVVPVRGYVILLLALLGVPSVVRIVRRLFRSRSHQQPTWREYTHDEFFGMVWRWRYDPMARSLAYLRCYCPQDDTALVFENRPAPSFSGQPDKVVFHCEHCNRQFGPLPGYKDHVLGRVQREIDRNIRTGQWRKVVTPNVAVK